MTPVIAFGEALVDMLSNKLGGQAVEQPEHHEQGGGQHQPAGDVDAADGDFRR